MRVDIVFKTVIVLHRIMCRCTCVPNTLCLCLLIHSLLSLVAFVFVKLAVGETPRQVGHLECSMGVGRQVRGMLAM